MIGTGSSRRNRPRLSTYSSATIRPPANGRATIAAAHQLDDHVPHKRMGEVSLRWIYVHLIEETARHAGHLDILREQLDGTTGFD